MDLSQPKVHKSYVRRKRCLNENAKNIQNALKHAATIKGEPINERDLQNKASEYAEYIKATCWSPKQNLTDDNYMQLTFAKTNELCNSIIKKAQIEAGQPPTLMQFQQMSQISQNPQIGTMPFQQPIGQQQQFQMMPLGMGINPPNSTRQKKSKSKDKLIQSSSLDNSVSKPQEVSQESFSPQAPIQTSE